MESPKEIENSADALKKILKTGTTTIGLIYKSGIIMATDSQATAGYFVASKNAQKLFKIKKYVAATIAGGVADCQYVINQARALSDLRELETGYPVGPHFVANIIRNILFGGRSYYYSMIMVGGWSVLENKPKLYGIDLLGTLFEEDKFLSFGSGSPYALGTIEAEWKEGLDEKEAVTLIKRALTSAVERDAGSGYKFQIIKIDKNGFMPIEGYMG